MKLKKATEKLKLVNKAIETLEKKLKFLLKEKTNFSTKLAKGIETGDLNVRYKSLMGIELPIYKFIKPIRFPLGINTPESAYIKREWLLKQHVQYAKYKTNKESVVILDLEIKKLMIKINALKLSSKRIAIDIKNIENRLEEEEREEVVVKKISLLE